jgi:integrase
VFFNYAAKKDWVRRSPAQHVENVGRPSGYARRAYSKAEIAAILDAAERLPHPERDRGRALILLLLYSGMRISDATWAARHALRPDGVLDYRVIKTSKRIGLAPELQPAAADALRKLPDSRVFFFQPDRDDDYHEALHALYNGEHFEKHLPAGIYDAALGEATRLVYKVLTLAGVKGGCHRFRDTFALTLLAAEVDVFTVSQMLGHSDVRITQKHYLNLIPGYIERMAQATRKLNYAA